MDLLALCGVDLVLELWRSEGFDLPPVRRHLEEMQASQTVLRTPPETIRALQRILHPERLATFARIVIAFVDGVAAPSSIHYWRATTYHASDVDQLIEGLANRDPPRFTTNEIEAKWRLREVVDNPSPQLVAAFTTAWGIGAYDFAYAMANEAG